MCLHIAYTISVENCGTIKDMMELFTELQNIIDWRTLGEELGVSVSKLDEIEEDYRKVKRRHTAVLQKWYESARNPQWRDVIRVLLKPSMGEKRRIAQRIAEQHGCEWEEFEPSD